MENPDSPRSQEYIDQSRARSSVARDFDNQASPPTPGQDDTPYIRFAIDQLTRDEDVRGSRAYPGERNPGVAYVVQPGDAQLRDVRPSVPGAYPEDNRLRDSQSEAGVAIGQAHAYPQPQPPASQQWPARAQDFDEPPVPPRSPKLASANAITRNNEKLSSQRRDSDRPDPFVYVPNDGQLHQKLSFVPAILRPLAMSLFVLFALVLLALLLATAISSLINSGLADYGYFGDSMYFVFEYLPTFLGAILFLWVVQIHVAVYRIAPFVAISSAHPRAREAGVDLPIHPKTFLLPYLGHFKAKQAVVGIFMLVAWLQIFTLPLLASTYNVYFYGEGDDGQWRWIATQAAIWIVIGLYILLVVSAIVLLIWLRKQETGLRWDPRSLADMVALLERSNALSMTEDDELRHEPARLGYWRTQRGNNEVFQSYGVADKSARRYGLNEDGKIR